MRERCEHEPCGFERRLEYCERDSERLYMDAQLIAELIDALIYRQTVVTSDHYHHESSSAGSISDRAFTQWEAYFGSVPETNVRLRHSYEPKFQAHFYDVSIAWRPEATGQQGCLETRYEIELYPAGNVHAAITYFDISEGQLQSRPMSEYDYVQLFEGLYKIDELHAIEAQDRYNSQLWSE